MRLRLAAAAAFLCCLPLTPSGHAADDLRTDLGQLQRLRDAVEVEADSLEYDEAQRNVVAKGKVHIVLGERSLFADEASVDLTDQELVATGNVILMEGLNRLEGDRIEYNYRTNLGVVTNGRARLGPGVSLSGVEIRREGERTYRVMDGRFTPCRACQPEPQTPDLELRAKEATAYLDDMVVARNGSLWVKGIPALFSPIIALPIGPRRTGFLIPYFGYGNADGFVYKQPFFWAISPSQDATLTPIIRTKRGFDLPVDYRYLLSENSRGEMTGRYLYDITPSAPQRDREQFTWRHDQELAPTWTGKADVRWQSDTTLNRNFVDTTVLERTQATLPSNIFVTQTTPQYMLLGLLNYTRDLENTTTTWAGRLPDVRFQWLPSQVLGTPLVAEGDTSAVYLVRNQGKSAGRFDLHPSIELPLPLSPWLTATNLAAVRETAYTESENSGGESNRTLVELGERLASRFGRDFDEPGLGLLRLTHIVEPTLAYQYVPWTDQQSLPQFDPTDFISPQNRVTYQLTNRLIARWREASGEIRSHEVATLDILQSWNMQPRTRQFSNVYLAGLTPERVDQAVNVLQDLGNGFSQVQERVWSDLVFNTTLSPIPGAAFRGTLALNPKDWTPDAVNAGIELRRSDLLTLEIGSTYAAYQQANGVVGRIELHPTKTILLDFLTRYNVNSSDFLENGVLLRYSSCCWEVGIKYTHRMRGPNQRPEDNVHVTFDLKNAMQPSRGWEGFKTRETGILGER
ncbi:MAG: LPS assembly protein LptD [Candidatus Methylomirabilota bacterium]|jgi:LPS-assembly protein